MTKSTYKILSIQDAKAELDQMKLRASVFHQGTETSIFNPPSDNSGRHLYNVHRSIRDALLSKKCSFFEHCSNGGGGQPTFQNFVGNCRSFWRSFDNIKFAWKGTFEAWMVKFGGEIGTLYQIFTPCTPLPKYKRAFTWFLGGSNSLPGCQRIFYRARP